MITLYFGLLRALWIVPLVIAATVMTGRAGLLPEDLATRGQPKPEKPPEPHPRLRIVGGSDENRGRRML